MDPQATQPPRTVLFRILLVLILLFVGLAIVYLYRSGSSSVPEQNASLTPAAPAESAITPSLPPTSGAFSLQPLSTTQLTANQPFDVEVSATSDGKSIVGYDMVLTFDPTAVDVQKATSLIEEFIVYPLKKDTYYSVTATKKVEVKTPNVFDNTPLVRFTLLPKKSGTVTLGLTRQSGVEKSQMVDEQSNVLIPQVNEITFEVE